MPSHPRRAEVEPVRWADLADGFRRYHRQGEHVSIVGPTGSGKTMLGLNLCMLIGSRRAKDGRPARVTVMATKPRDRTLQALGWPRVRDWPPAYGQEHCVVWPSAPNPETAALRKRQAFGPIMRQIYQEGGQTVYIDEVAYFSEQPPNGLGMAATLTEYWQSARALDLTLVAGTQRPRHVPRAMWSECSWLFVFRVEDLDDLRRVAEVGGRDRLLGAVEGLGGHEFVVVHRPRGGGRAMYVSRVESESER
jgi:hypothetical protein